MKKLKSTDEILTDEWDGTGDEIADVLTQDRNQAYTSLVEEINKALFDNCDNYADGTHYCNGYEQACADIIEKVVKPLYGKE